MSITVGKTFYTSERSEWRKYLAEHFAEAIYRSLHAPGEGDGPVSQTEDK